MKKKTIAEKTMYRKCIIALQWEEISNFLFSTKNIIKQLVTANANLRHCLKSVRIRSFFWSVFSRILLHISLCSAWIRKNTDQKKFRNWTLFTQCDEKVKDSSDITNDIKVHPANIYLLKVNNKGTRKRCKICSKLTIKTPQICQWLCSGVFVVNFEHISYIFLVFLLLTLNE